jgi:hypothetical protein
MLINANGLLKYVNHTIMNHLQFITDTVNSYPDRQVMFNDAIKVKASPHISLFSCYGVCVHSGAVFLMDDSGYWHGPLLESQANAELMIASLYQRLKVMAPPVSVVVAKYDEQVNATIFE